MNPGTPDGLAVTDSHKPGDIMNEESFLEIFCMYLYYQKHINIEKNERSDIGMLTISSTICLQHNIYFKMATKFLLRVMIYMYNVILSSAQQIKTGPLMIDETKLKLTPYLKTNLN